MIKKQIWVSAGDDYKSPLSMCPCLLSLLGAHENDTSYLYYAASEGHLHITNQPLAIDTFATTEPSLLRQYKLPLYHSAACKCQSFRDTLEKSNGGSPNVKTSVSTCAIVMDNKNNILLTRRTPNLTLFPSAWVTPGGHVEIGEEIETAVLREVEEEIGIKVECVDSTGQYLYEGKECRLEPFLLFESSFVKEETLFLRQSMIVFYTLRLPVDSESVMLKMQRSEVDCYGWLPFEYIPKIVDGKSGMEEFPAFYAQPNGSVMKRLMPLKVLFGPYPNEWNEGIAGGHIIALKRLSETLITK